MKKTLLLIVIILVSLNTYAQCGNYYKNKIFSLTDVRFWDENNGFVIGGSSLLTTHNGGISWETYELPYLEVPAFNDIELIDSNKAIVLGANGTILYTDNKGINWQRRIGIQGLEFFTGVNFVDTSIGYAVGVKGYPFNNTAFLYKTTDGGENWLEVISNISSLNYSNFLPKDIIFLDENTGFTWAGNKFYKTIDGGENWIEQNTPSNLSMQKLQFIDAQTAFASIGSGIYKTTDGANSWTQTSYSVEWTTGAFTVNNDYIYYSSFVNNGIKKVNINTDTQEANGIIKQDGYLADVYFLNDNIGFAVGKKQQNSWDMGRFIYKTTDGGVNWNQLDSGSPKEGNINRAHYFKKINENEYVYSVNSSGNYTHSSILLSKDKGASWKKVYENEDVSGFTLYAEGSYMSHWSYINPNNSAAGFRISESFDKGTTWIEGPILMNSDLPSGISFYGNIFTQVSENDLFINNYSNVYRSTDKGLTWNLITTPNGVTSRQYQFIDANNFAFYGSGPNSEPTLYVTNDGGLTWTLVAQISGYAHNLQYDRFDYSNPDKIYIYPRYPGGKIFTYNIASQTLSEETMPYYINKIKAIGNDSLIILDNSGNIYISHDNGATWTQRNWEGYGVSYPNIYVENEDNIILWEYNFIQNLKKHTPIEPEAIFGNDDVFVNTEWEYIIPADLISSTEWQLNSGGSLIIDANTSYYKVKVLWDTIGTHTLKAKKINDCGESIFTEIIVTVNAELSIEDFNREKTKIYPNPFTNYLQIELPKGFENENLNLSLINILGQTVYEERANSTSQTIELNNIPNSINAGVYFIKIASRKTTITKKVIKR